MSRILSQDSVTSKPENQPSRAGDLLMLPVALLALWTLAYQIVLVTRLPAWTAMALFGLFFGLVAILCWRTNFAPWRSYEFHPAHLVVLLLGLICGTAALFIWRPNQDDIVYFHRALAQLGHLSKPIFTRQTSVDVDAAAFSPVHLATSHELLMALLGHFLGINPVYSYQVLGHVLAEFSLPFIFYFCVRCFAVERWRAVFGVICTLAFFVIDSHGLASYGNTAVARMWQGKAIVWIVYVPIAISLTYRYLAYAKTIDVVWLSLTAISGVGLSNSALYQVPAAVGCSCLAGLAVGTWQDRREIFPTIKRCLVLALPLVYPVAILVLLLANIIPKPTDMHGFGPAIIPWRKGVDYVVGGPPEMWRDVAILIVVPSCILQGTRGAFLFLYNCAIAVLCLNPLLAHFWMKSITASCYFRLVYLMPVPLLLSFLPTAVPGKTSAVKGFLQRAVQVTGGLAVIAACVFNYGRLGFTPKNRRLGWKSPGACQILPENLEFARAAGSYIAHGKLLAPVWTASCELPLLFPKMKVVAPRLATHYFANAHKKKEGALRRMAQAFVEGEKPSDSRRAVALLRSFQIVVTSGRVTAMAVPQKESQRVLDALQSIDARWQKVLTAGGLTLIVPKKDTTNKAGSGA